jgi:hypothetical protein
MPFPQGRFWVHMARWPLILLVLASILLQGGCGTLPGTVSPAPSSTPDVLVSPLVTDSFSVPWPSATPTIDPRSTPLPTKSPADAASAALLHAIQSGERTRITSWGEPLSLAEVNHSVHSLSNSDLDALCELLLDTNASPGERKKVLAILKNLLSHPDLGFFAEIFSYTTVRFEGSGFFAGDGCIYLDEQAFFDMEVTSQRNVLMHETFHCFNARNGPVFDALNEGSAVFVRKRPFPEEYVDGEDFAETVYGTVNYYRDIMDGTSALVAPQRFTNRLLEVYAWLSAGDPSHLVWWDTSILNALYHKYYEEIDRDVDFFSVWLPAMVQAREQMLADPLMARDALPPLPTASP